MSLKVFFYHANDLLAGTNTLFLSVVVPYLKTYIDYNTPEIADSIEWVLPSQYKKTDEELIQFCNEQNIDVLCTSHYIWNNTFLMDQITRVKPYLNPNILIVSGGPALDVNVNPNFFDQYPFIDYAIYGPGEIAFADLAKSLITDKKLIAFNTSNIAWKDKSTNKINIANFKYVPELKQSPYLHCEKILEETMKSTDGHLALMPYELTRGCPYSCTFCDWNSGFGNKTTRRKNSFKEEIDMFQKLGITSLYLSDANVGQYDEDVELVAYLAEKNIKENANFKVNGNFSKLKLENNLKIYHLLVQGNLLNEWGMPLAVQDIHEDILKNIDRPDLGWDKHVKVITELKNYYPDMLIKAQILIGLPGQTITTLCKTFNEISKYDIVLMPYMYELLFASPAAYNKTYQSKFNFTYSSSLRYSSFSNTFFRGSIPESCVSFTKRDMVEMSVLTTFYHAIISLREITKNNRTKYFNIEYVVEEFLKSEYFKNLSENLYNNWNEDKFYFTIDFDGTEKICSACIFEATSAIWIKNKHFINWLQKLNPEINIINSWIKNKEAQLSSSL